MAKEREARYTKFLPENLQDIYESGISDPHLLHLRQEIGIIDLHLKLLLETVDANVLETDEIESEIREKFPDIDEGTIPDLARYIRSMQPEHFIDNRTFRRLESKVDQYENAMTRRELRKADASLRELFRSIREGRRAGDIWNDIHATMDQRKGLVGAEQKRLLDQAQMLTIEKVVLLLELTIQSLREAVGIYVQDEEIRDYILVEAERVYAELLSGGSGQAAYQIDMD